MPSTSATSTKGTRQQLIDAGIEVFGLYGFQGATTRQIAKVAGVNLAAIPYYFGGKEDLYRAVVETIVEQIVQEGFNSKRELCMPEDPDSLTDDELIELTMKNIALFADCLEEEEKGAAIKLIIAREQILPSTAFPILYERLSRPLYDLFCETIGRLMRRDRNDPEVIVQVHSLIAQVIFFSIGRASLKKQLNSEMLSAEHIETILNVVRMNTRAILNNLRSYERPAKKDGTADD